MNNKQFYIGLMSGTSADGIDLALVDFSLNTPKLVTSYYQAYDDKTHQAITQLYQSSDNEIERAFKLDIMLAQQFSEAINNLLSDTKIAASDICAIGNHGQTIRHRPNSTQQVNNFPFTLQIGCSQTLACLTNIRVIGQFRKKDIALGGQGAPLVPAFHQALFNNYQQDVIVVNIGGIANITYLPAEPEKNIIGFDTGPGNALLDSWYQQHNSGKYDNNGHWAAQGKINQYLLHHLLQDDYFHLPAPKSTGREIFHLNWLNNKLPPAAISAMDMQATLTALTADSIANAIKTLTPKAHVYLCGGGIKNETLCARIKEKLPNFIISNTEQVGINSDALEAMAFAWFAYAFDQQICGNIPTVTGAYKATVLGTPYTP